MINLSDAGTKNTIVLIAMLMYLLIDL